MEEDLRRHNFFLNIIQRKGTDGEETMRKEKFTVEMAKKYLLWMDEEIYVTEEEIVNETQEAFE